MMRLKNDPETIPGHDYPRQIAHVSFLRLMGVFKPHKGKKCSVVGCDELAICRVGQGGNHPSCESHAVGEDYIQPLTSEQEEEDPGAFERYLMY